MTNDSSARASAYTIRFSNAPGTQAITVPAGSSVILPQPAPQAGQKFTFWRDAGDQMRGLFKAGASFTPTADITLKALWCGQCSADLSNYYTKTETEALLSQRQPAGDYVCQQGAENFTGTGDEINEKLNNLCKYVARSVIFTLTEDYSGNWNVFGLVGYGSVAIDLGGHTLTGCPSIQKNTVTVTISNGTIAPASDPGMRPYAASNMLVRYSNVTFAQSAGYIRFWDNNIVYFDSCTLNNQAPIASNATRFTMRAGTSGSGDFVLGHSNSLYITNDSSGYTGAINNAYGGDNLVVDGRAGHPADTFVRK